MIEHQRSLDDGQEGRGSVNTVMRQGNEVHRPIGDWSVAVHGLLQHLSSKGFAFSPRFLGIDVANGKERLTYIDGQVAMRPWPDCLCVDNGIEQIGKMLRSYHDAIRDYEPLAESRWRDPTAKWQDGMIVRHGDLGPWNMVWDSDKLVGVIDWDLAEPGYPLDDLAQVAWYCIPLRTQGGCREAGIEMQLIADRLKCLCTTYGADPDEVLEALAALQKREIARMKYLSKVGIEPWVEFNNRGDTSDVAQESAWLLSIIEGAQQGARVGALASATKL